MKITTQPTETTVAITKDRRFFLELEPIDCLTNDASTASRWAEEQLDPEDRAGIRNYFYSDLVDMLDEIWKQNDFSARLEAFAWDWAQMREVMGFREYKEVCIPAGNDEWAPPTRDQYRKEWVVTEALDGDTVIAVESRFGRLYFESLNNVRDSAVYLIEKHGHSTRGAIIDMFISKNFPMQIKSTLGFDAQIFKNGAIEVLAKTTLPAQPTVTADNVVENDPPVEEGILWLVNARVFSASTRQDFVMFDPEKTIRDAEGKAVAQGGYITREGVSHNFLDA